MKQVYEYQFKILYLNIYLNQDDCTMIHKKTIPYDIIEEYNNFFRNDTILAEIRKAMYGISHV